MPPAVTFSNCIVLKEFIFGFRMIFGINRDYFSKRHEPFDLSIGEWLCFFKVRIEFLNITYMCFDFVGLISRSEEECMVLYRI
jgi:hypothetical protein